MRCLLPIALIMSGCGDQSPTEAGRSSVANESQPADNRVSRPAELIPMPEDQAEADRLILAGYTPHSDHLHAPGVRSCPLARDGEAVM